jgi:flagellum-specific ATP synthase
VIDLSGYATLARDSRGPSPVGQVHDVVGLLIEVAGLSAATGDRLVVKLAHGPLIVQVLGFKHGRLLCAPLGKSTGVEPGAPVRWHAHGPTIPAGEALLGRVIDAFGVPLDDRKAPACSARAPLTREPPPSFGRRPIEAPFETGVRVIDSLLPLGRGQRIGLFAGTGVGKSTLLAMLCRNAIADVVVVGLVGERGREVGDFVQKALGDGLKKSVVVAATSDAAPLVRVQGALAATAIAEYFRDQGKSVLLVMDSVTRYAMALREASLAAGEPPVTKGYTPSVFASLPTLLERAGTTASEGSITAIYTVLVEGDDLNDPIADAVRGILDGHIVLSRTLAERGLFPAVDVLKSISRVFEDVTTDAHKRVAIEARGHMGTFRDASDLIKIGAYVPGADPRIDAAQKMVPRLESFARQGLHERSRKTESLELLGSILQRP